MRFCSWSTWLLLEDLLHLVLLPGPASQVENSIGHFGLAEGLELEADSLSRAELWQWRCCGPTLGSGEVVINNRAATWGKGAKCAGAETSFKIKKPTYLQLLLTKKVSVVLVPNFCFF